MAVDAYIELDQAGFVELLEATTNDTVEVIQAGPPGPPGRPSTDANNAISVGSDGGLYANPTGVQLSSDAGNIITTGSDGGLYATGGGGTGNATPSADAGNILEVSPNDGGLYVPAPPAPPTLGSLGGMPAATTLDEIPTAAADVDLGGHKITNVETPTDSTDAVNKAYADSLVPGLEGPTPLYVSASDPVGTFPDGSQYYNSTIQQVCIMVGGVWTVQSGITVSDTPPDTTAWKIGQYWLDPDPA